LLPLVGEQIIGQVTSNSVVVRTPKPEDAAQVGEAHAKAWEEGYSQLFAPVVLTELADARRSLWSHIFIDPSFDFESMLVAERAGEVVGYSHFGDGSETDTEGEVFGFYAHPKVWGTGVSTVLMNASLERLRGRSFSGVMLWTLVGAGRARAFYEKCGFTLTGRERTGTVFPTGSEVFEVEYRMSL
jgi:GNAT superfamily N-acetyltransferase